MHLIILWSNDIIFWVILLAQIVTNDSFFHKTTLSVPFWPAASCGEELAALWLQALSRVNRTRNHGKGCALAKWTKPHKALETRGSIFPFSRKVGYSMKWKLVHCCILMNTWYHLSLHCQTRFEKWSIIDTYAFNALKWVQALWLAPQLLNPNFWGRSRRNCEPQRLLDLKELPPFRTSLLDLLNISSNNWNCLIIATNCRVSGHFMGIALPWGAVHGRGAEAGW